jgi:hypothetical protein
MTMDKGQRYRCQDANCRLEVVVIEPSKEAVLNPRCCCGGEMKRRYTKPRFKRLDFKPVDSDDFAKLKG